MNRRQKSKRMMERRKEDKDRNRKVVVPPANTGIQPPGNHIKIQLDTKQLTSRKARPKHAVASVVKPHESNPIPSILCPFSLFKSLPQPFAMRCN